MANIRVDLERPITNGQSITFRSPTDCSNISGLKVYYPVNGIESSTVFELTDSHGNNVGDIDDLFTEDVLVKVILDTELKKAYVQNADTNAYLEAKFDDKLNKSGGTMTGPINMGKKKITNVAEPTSDTDVATKKYIDGKIVFLEVEPEDWSTVELKPGSICLIPEDEE